MANEAEIINNPTSTPEAVSTGYQRQNTMTIAERVGVDKSVVTAGVASADVKVSGPVDVNGVLYSIKSAVNLAIASDGRYFIYLSGTGDNLTPIIGTDSGTWDDSKNGRYTASGYRVLNWIISYDGTTVIVNRLLTPEYDSDGEAQNYIPDLDTQPEFYITSDGTWTAPRSKYYNFWCTGKGGDGTTGDDVISAYRGGGGGGGGATGFIRKFIEAGTVWTAVFSSSSGGNCTFSDGTTTLTFQNGTNGGTAFNGGAGGSTLTGFDFSVKGSYGFSGQIELTASYSSARGGGGGYCAFPFSVAGSDTPLSTSESGENGGGGAGAIYPSGTAGSGGSAAIRIIG